MACRIGLFVALLVAALEARDGDTVVTNMTIVTNVTMTSIACPNGSFPDYGENATSPEGLDLCVRVSGEVWSAAGVFMLLFGSLSLLGVMAVRVGAQIIQRSKQPTYTSSLIPDWISRSYYGNFGKVCILLIFDFLLLGAYQRDYDNGFIVLVSVATFGFAMTVFVSVHV